MEVCRPPYISRGIPMQTTILRNGIEMPLEGFGVFQVPDPVRTSPLGGSGGSRLSAYRYGFGLSE
ncbi:hypothetical protein HMPREF0179_05255 [Bilophila wadsworthia 3_1_6]|uniref:Uncharacterized protein n=2 Tax=Bilophila wadsworthia TaxID=35833 RepID=S2KT59_BILW3|nr:hypothetical protein HMPREF0179_05255 [Bilophila wadsworthia 3_1_6]